jgi:hypothetical protein
MDIANAKRIFMKVILNNPHAVKTAIWQIIDHKYFGNVDQCHDILNSENYQ